MKKLEPPKAFWLPRPYSDDDHRDVVVVMEDRADEFVPWANLYNLAKAMERARRSGVELVVTEGDPADGYPALVGWAAAVGAKDLATKSTTPQPPDDIVELLDQLRMYGNNDWADFKTNVGPMSKLNGQRLADAGYGPDYVVRVAARRGELELSQEKAAERIGVHWTYLGQVERGRRNVTLHNILKIAEGLEIAPGELVDGLKVPDA